MKLVITISRRYGTGASQIAGELSEQLGIPVYDKTHVEEKMCSNSYDSEAAVIKELAMKPCIILGRCASEILKDQKVPESVSDCMEILVNAVQKNKKAMIHLYRSIQRDVFADYLDHAAERVVEELINRAVGDFEMDQEDRHLISRYYKCVFVGVILDWLRHDMDYDILSDMHKLEYIYEKSLESQYKNLK